MVWPLWKRGEPDNTFIAFVQVLLSHNPISPASYELTCTLSECHRHRVIYYDDIVYHCKSWETTPMSLRRKPVKWTMTLPHNTVEYHAVVKKEWRRTLCTDMERFLRCFVYMVFYLMRKTEGEWKYVFSLIKKHWNNNELVQMVTTAQRRMGWGGQGEGESFESLSSHFVLVLKMWVYYYSTT